MPKTEGGDQGGWPHTAKQGGIKVHCDVYLQMSDWDLERGRLIAGIIAEDEMMP